MYIKWYMIPVTFMSQTHAITCVSFLKPGAFMEQFSKNRGVCIKGVYAVLYVPLNAQRTLLNSHVGYKELKHNNTHSSNNLKLPCTTNTTSFSFNIHVIIMQCISLLSLSNK